MRVVSPSIVQTTINFSSILPSDGRLPVTASSLVLIRFAHDRRLVVVVFFVVLVIIVVGISWRHRLASP
jgi:hypothetical protein